MEKAVSSLDFIPKIKRLPRVEETGQIDSHFKANGKTYYLISSDEGIPIGRWGLYKKFGLQAGAGMTFQKLYNNSIERGQLLNKYVEREIQFSELLLHNEAESKALATLSTERFDQALYLCTLFIVTKDEDLTTWSKAIAEEKIQDWIKEGYSISDFFTLASSSIQGCDVMLKKAMQQDTLEVEKEWRHVFTESTNSEQMD